VLVIDEAQDLAVTVLEQDPVCCQSRDRDAEAAPDRSHRPAGTRPCTAIAGVAPVEPADHRPAIT